MRGEGRHYFSEAICAHCGVSFMSRTDAIKKGEGRYCSKPCSGHAGKPIDPVQHFFDHVQKTDKCWLWIGGMDKDGYGRFTFGGRTRGAHRYSYSTFVGPIADGLLVCHHCDNPRCVRPDHLFLGTNIDNLRDASNKCRMAIGLRNGKYTKPEKTPRGSKHGNAVLTEVDIPIIRNMCRTMSNKEIGDKFGVSRSSIYYIRIGKNWAHIP